MWPTLSVKTACSIYTQDISPKSSDLLRLNLILNNWFTPSRHSATTPIKK